ncbi:MAG: maleylacetoacetate isomerase [Dongiaceae bacterium]
MRLYGYFRSSAVYRVRIALNLKQLPHDTVAVHLLRDGGEQHRPDYVARNPQGLVPALETNDGAILTQSLAIIEYLDEIRPQPPLLPGGPLDRALIRAMALAVAADIHPLNNLRVLERLRRELGQGEAAVGAWYRHWVESGLAALEQLVRRGPGGGFCYGAGPTLADCCLVPQMANARRFECDLGACPTLVAIDARCRELPPFAAAAPERQADAE